MHIVLNEYSLALLCGGISCITYLLVSFGQQSGRSVRPEESGKKQSKRHKPILRSGSHSEAQESPNDEEIRLRLLSSNRAKQRRSETLHVKSDHVMFADEITPGDQRFSPMHDEIPAELIEGILSKSEDEVQLAVNPDIVDAEPLNRFEEILPLDDRLLRRRSLHSTPSGSQHGSRSNLSAIGREGEGRDSPIEIGDSSGDTWDSDMDEKPTVELGEVQAPALDGMHQLSNYRNRVELLQHELKEKREETSRQTRSLLLLEDSLEAERSDKERMSESLIQLRAVLKVALAKLEGKSDLAEVDESLLNQYILTQSTLEP